MQIAAMAMFLCKVKYINNKNVKISVYKRNTFKDLHGLNKFFSVLSLNVYRNIKKKCNALYVLLMFNDKLKEIIFNTYSVDPIV